MSLHRNLAGTWIWPYLSCYDSVSFNILFYYMTSSVSGQDEPNRALWLATRAGKMERYCPLGISRLVPQDQRSFFGVLSHIINPLLTKIVRSRWLDIGLVFFCVFMDLDFVSVHKHAKKELGQYPVILTSRLVNNPYIYNSLIWIQFSYSVLADLKNNRYKDNFLNS